MARAAPAFLLLLLAPPALGAPISADQARAHIGETATVTGQVSLHRTRAGETYLDLDGSGDGAPLSAYISRWNAVKFQDAAKLDGKQVQITGRIATFRGRPEIFLTDPGQIAIK
jgi:DNA/RNA endonuclease YhcR with UshA esterase domain